MFATCLQILKGLLVVRSEVCVLCQFSLVVVFEGVYAGLCLFATGHAANKAN